MQKKSPAQTLFFIFLTVYEHYFWCVQIQESSHLFNFLLTAFARAAVGLGVLHCKVIQRFLAFGSALRVSFSYKIREKDGIQLLTSRQCANDCNKCNNKYMFQLKSSSDTIYSSGQI